MEMKDNNNKSAKLEVLKDLISQMNDVMSERIGGPAKMEMEISAEPLDQEEMKDEAHDVMMDIPEMEPMKPVSPVGLENEEEIHNDEEGPAPDMSHEEDMDEESPKSLALMKLKKKMEIK